MKKLITITLALMLSLGAWANGATPTVISAWNYATQTASMPENNWPATSGVVTGTNLQFFYASEAQATLGHADRNAVNVSNIGGNAVANGWFLTPDGVGNATVPREPITAQNAAGWVITLNTTGFEDITFSASQAATGSGPRDFALAYRIGTTGVWTPFGDIVAIPDEGGTGAANPLSLTFDEIALPANVNDEVVVQLKVFIATAYNRGGTALAANNGNTSINNIVFSGIGSGDPFAGLETPPALDPPSAGFVTIAIHVDTDDVCNGMGVVGDGTPSAWVITQALNNRFERAPGRDNWYVITLPVPTGTQVVRPVGITPENTTDWPFNASVMEILQGTGEVVSGGYNPGRELQFRNLEEGVVFAVIREWFTSPCILPPPANPETDWLLQIHGSVAAPNGWAQANATFTSSPDPGTYVFTFTNVTLHPGAFGVRIMPSATPTTGQIQWIALPMLQLMGDTESFSGTSGNVNVTAETMFQTIILTLTAPNLAVATNPVTAATMYFEAVDLGNIGGTSGDLTWVVYDNVLTISVTADAPETADMEDFPLPGGLGDAGLSPAPWTAYSALFNTVVIAERVTSIGENAFRGVREITTLTLGENLETIGGNAFRGLTQLAAVVIPNSVTEIGAEAFRGPNVRGTHADASVLASVTIGTGVVTIGEEAFRHLHNLTSIVIPSNVRTIGNRVFDETGLTSVTFNEGLETIGNRAFEGEGNNNRVPLTSVVIPNSVTTIGYQAFRRTDIETITFGTGVTTIGANVLQQSPNVETIISLSETPPTALANTFAGIDLEAICLYVPAGSVEAYQAATGWSVFTCIEAGTDASIALIRGNDISIFPNPVRDILTVTVADFAQGMMFNLFDVNGRMVQTGTLAETTTIDMTNLRAGTYVLTIVQNGVQVATFRVVKQ